MVEFSGAVPVERQFWRTKRPILHDEARESITRLINSHFMNDAERARISIPANPDRDDDLIAHSYVEQQREREALSEWQTIETAPRNVSVLIFIPNAEHYGHGVYRGMLVDTGTGPHWSANALHMGRDCGWDNRPTHWMPLPEPPVRP